MFGQLTIGTDGLARAVASHDAAGALFGIEHAPSKHEARTAAWR